jgi:hypothetical protein
MAYRARESQGPRGAVLRAAVWTAAAPAVLREAEADLGPSSPAQLAMRDAHGELRGPHATEFGFLRLPQPSRRR